MAQQIYSLVITGTSGPQFVQNVLHYQFDDAGYSTSKGAAEALAIAWDTANKTKWRNMLPTDYTIRSYTSTRITGSGGFSAFSPTTAAAGLRPGTISASALNPLIIMFPFSPTERGRGKIFLPGVSEQDIDDGIYTDAYRAAIEAQLTTILDDLTLAGGGTPNAVNGWVKRNGTTFVASDKVYLSPNLGTQRRRMRPA